MVMVRIDGKGGSVFDSRKDAERELELWGFRPCLNGYEKYLFTGQGVKTMTATIERG